MTERYLVCHDYGMGALWWWIRAQSPAEIVLTFAEVEVREDGAALEFASAWQLEELTLTEAVTGALAAFAEKRAEQRGDPDFARLLGRDRVCVRHVEDDVPGEWFVELDRTGRRVRQVELRPDGSAEATTDEDWPFNPPEDLADPALARKEIPRARFEELWRRAGR